MILIKKECSKCGNIKKFVQGTPRDKEATCGDCWDWTARPPQPLDLVGGSLEAK